MVGELVFEKGKLVTPNATASLYSPPEDVRVLTAQVKKDYAIGMEILHRPYSQFGELLSPLQVYERDLKRFNSFEEPDSLDPDENWRWKGVRPLTRNKIIGIAAHFVAALLYPNVFAQNKDDEEDRNAAEMMKDFVEYYIENSNYTISYLFGIIAALFSPVAYLNVEFVEAIQKIKERLADGTIAYKEAVDEVFSGINFNNVPMEEILVTNAFEYEFQKQRAVIRRRLIDFTEAQTRYGNHDNFKFVQPGIKVLYDATSSAFYNIIDIDNPTLVEEVIYYNRLNDLEVPFINGIYLGEEKVESNLIKHRHITQDKTGKMILVPLYPYVKFGYGPIDEKRFYFYKSAVNEFGSQQKLVDRIWQMVVNGTFLATVPPLAVTGNNIIKSNVIYPGAVTIFPDRETTITPIGTGANLATGYNLLAKAEADINETSRLPQLPAKSGTTAFEVAREEQQSRIQLGLFGMMVAEAVTQLGRLLIDVILLHQMTSEVEEITAGETRLRFRKFVMANRMEDNQKVTKIIHLTDEELNGSLGASLELLQQEGSLDSEKRIYKINPSYFRRLKWLIRVDPDQWVPKNEIFEKAFSLEGYDRMIANPFIDQETVTRDFLVEVYAKGEANKYMKKATMPLPTEGVGERSTAANAPANLVSQITGTSPLAALLRST